MERTSTAMMHEWRPKHGVMMTVTMMVILAIVVALIVWSSMTAYAQTGVIKSDPGFDVKGVMNTLIPVLWASIGPMVIAFLTKSVNSLSGQYVPRPLQVILSSILGALGAGLADGGITAAATAVAGGASQLYAGADPEALRTSQKK